MLHKVNAMLEQVDYEHNTESWPIKQTIYEEQFSLENQVLIKRNKMKE